jgi:branched-subunit amino acid ABC-type transport system permease component
MIQILLYGLVTGTQVLLVALALFLVYSVSRVFNLAFGAIAAAVAYSLYFAIHASLPLWFMIALPLAVAIVLGILNFFLNESFVKKQEYLFALLVSFSFGVMLESLISIIFGTDGKSLISGILPVLEFGQYQIPLPGSIMIGLGAFLGIVSFLSVRYTPWGRMLRSISENPFSAISLGLNSKKIRLFAYVLGSLLVGMVGILAGFNTALTPYMGFQIIVMAFIAFLVGGVSDIKGTIVASYLIVLVPEFLIGSSQTISTNWWMVLVFGVALISLVFRPEGLFAGRQRKS